VFFYYSVKIERVIEEFNQLDEYLNREYILNISPEEILATLDDLVLSKDDFPHEIYNCYDLNENQIQKLRPFLTEEIYPDFDKYTYQLSCYEDRY